MAPRPEAALQPGRLEGERARMPEAEVGARRDDVLVDRSATNSVGTSSSQPSSPVNETRSASACPRPTSICARLEERPGIARQVGVGEAGQDLP